jgi:hypothetical protein
MQQPAAKNAPEEEHIACDDQRKPYSSERPEACEKSGVEYDGGNRGRCEQDVEANPHGETNSTWGSAHDQYTNEGEPEEERTQAGVEVHTRVRQEHDAGEYREQHNADPDGGNVEPCRSGAECDHAGNLYPSIWAYLFRSRSVPSTWRESAGTLPPIDQLPNLGGLD